MSENNDSVEKPETPEATEAPEASATPEPASDAPGRASVTENPVAATGSKKKYKTSDGKALDPNMTNWTEEEIEQWKRTYNDNDDMNCH